MPVKFKLNKNYFNLFVFVLLLSACSKEAGDGGMASIKGKMFIEDYDNTFTIKKSVYPAQGEMIFIVYGDKVGVSDNVRTSYDGSFEFPNLRLGKYKVFAVSKDTSDKFSNKTMEVLREVEIKDKKKSYTVEDIYIAD